MHRPQQDGPGLVVEADDDARRGKVLPVSVGSLTPVKNLSKLEQRCGKHVVVKETEESRIS